MIKKIFSCFFKALLLFFILYVSHNIYLTAEAYYLQSKLSQKVDEKEAFKYMSQTTMPKDCNITASNGFVVPPQEIYPNLVSQKELKKGISYSFKPVLMDDFTAWEFIASLEINSSDSRTYHYSLDGIYHVEDDKVKIDECEMDVYAY